MIKNKQLKSNLNKKLKKIWLLRIKIKRKMAKKGAGHREKF